MKHSSTIRRFGSREIDTANAIGLRADHPALQGDGRTLFPTTVVGSLESPRFLVSGHNNPKLGKEVLKGERKGWPIFHLTLEERATCPRTCEQWASCYGNAMPQARRHAVDEHFLPLLRAEVATLARANPKGLLIRLHALGDFYSAEYVLAWAELLAMFPQLAVFGYTARRIDDPDPESAKIARVIAVMTETMWDRFSIRTSASDPIARSRSIVVDADPEEPDTIVCPAQTGATEACATCGLCWAPSARDKTIAFLRHGMTRTRGPRAAPEPVQAAPAPVEIAVIAAPEIAASGPYVPIPVRLARKIEAAAPSLFAAHPEGVPVGPIMEAVDATYNQTTIALSQLHSDGKVSWVRATSLDKHKVMRPAGRLGTAEALTAHQQTMLDLLSAEAVNSLVRIDRPALRKASGMQMASVDLVIDALRRKGFTERVPAKLGEAFVTYRVLKPSVRELARPSVPAPQSKLWAPVEPLAKRPARPLPATDCPAVPAPAPAAAPPAAPVGFDEAWMAPIGEPGTLASLGYGDCRWPLDSHPPGQMDQTTFCAKPALQGGPYCHTHENRARGRNAEARS